MNAFSAVWEDLRKKAGEKRGMRRRVKEEMVSSEAFDTSRIAVM